MYHPSFKIPSIPMETFTNEIYAQENASAKSHYNPNISTPSSLNFEQLLLTKNLPKIMLFIK